MKVKTLVFTLLLMALGSAVGIGGAFLLFDQNFTGLSIFSSGFNVVFIMGILFIISIAILKFVK
jgi:hypothetical protein